MELTRLAGDGRRRGPAGRDPRPGLRHAAPCSRAHSSSASAGRTSTATTSPLKRSRPAPSPLVVGAAARARRPLQFRSTTCGRRCRRPPSRSSTIRRRALDVAAVTGTNGKTTTAFLLRSILEAAGRRPALLTNIVRIVGGHERPTGLNTPEAIDLQRLFREMLDAGDRSCVMEATSIAAAQGPTRRYALRGACLHEPDAGPPRLPRDDGGVLRRQARAVRAGRRRGRQRRRRVGTAPCSTSCREQLPFSRTTTLATWI